jgi:hypothetical protein
MYHDFTKYFGLIIPKSQSVVEISLSPIFSPVLRQYQKPIAMIRPNPSIFGDGVFGKVGNYKEFVVVNHN